MPVSDRFAGTKTWLAAALRSNPNAAAMIAGALVLACGVGFVAAMSSTSKSRDGAAVQAAASPTVRETTGSAPRAEAPLPAERTARDGGDKNATADCQEQTWPYIARPCLAGEVPKRRVRVISTDRISEDVARVIETPPARVTNRIEAPKTVARPLPPPNLAPQPLPQAPAAAPAPAPVPDRAAQSQPIPSPPAVASVPQPIPSPPPVVSVPSPPAAEAAKRPDRSASAKVEPPAQPQPQPQPAQPPQVQLQAPAAAAAVVPQRAEPPVAERKMSAREKRAERRAERAARRAEARARREAARMEATARRAARSPEPDEDTDRRGRPRIVERWIEREYEVPTAGGRHRRVIVIRRAEIGR